MFKKTLSFAFRPIADAYRRTRSVASLSAVAAGAARDKIVHVTSGGLAAAIETEPAVAGPAPANVLSRLRRISRFAQIAAAGAIAFTIYWLTAGTGNFVENLNFVVFSTFTVGIAAVTAFVFATARGVEKRSFGRFLLSPADVLTAPWR
ncbi:MAG: hypothetical protein ING19_16310 [Azospirillum sp.]|nr:hypothetical protein [Azospirillum sp.]